MKRRVDFLSVAQRLHRMTAFCWLAIEAQKGITEPPPLEKAELRADQEAKSLRVLRSAVIVRADIEQLVTQTVNQARDAGASWEQIGEALGLRGAGVHRKYRDGATRSWDGLHGAAGDRRIEEVVRGIAASPGITEPFTDRHYIGPEIG